MWQCLNPHVTYSSTNGKGKIHMQKRKTNRVKFPQKNKQRWIQYQTSIIGSYYNSCTSLSWISFRSTIKFKSARALIMVIGTPPSHKHQIIADPKIKTTRYYIKLSSNLKYVLIIRNENNKKKESGSLHSTTTQWFVVLIAQLTPDPVHSVSSCGLFFDTWSEDVSPLVAEGNCK